MKKNFFHGMFYIYIYTYIVEGFAIKGKKNTMCRLTNNQNGLKQPERMV